MEQNINYLFFIIIPVITFVRYLIVEGLLMITLLGGLFLVLNLFYFYRVHSRKETLNIIRDREMLYFNLSDDLLFSVKITNDTKLNDLLIETVKREMVTIKDVVYRIDFVNFKNDLLNQELNALIKQHS